MSEKEWKKVSSQLQDKIKDLERKIKKASNNNALGEYFRLSYIKYEHQAKNLLINLEEDVPDDFDLGDAINRIEEIMEEKLVERNEFENWRNVRNKYAHEGLEITEEVAKEAKSYFEKFEPRYLDFLQSCFPQTDYHGTLLFEDEHAFLMAIEKMLGKPIPRKVPRGFDELFGFWEDEGCVQGIVLNDVELKNSFTFEGELAVLTPRREFLRVKWLN